MPEFIKATYNTEGKDDYALKARITMDGLAEHPKETEYIYAYAASFLRYAGKYDESIEICRKALPELKIWDCKSDTFSVLIQCLEKLNRHEEAIEVRLQFMEEDGNEISHLENLAKAYNKIGDVEKSIECYERYIEECDNECEPETFNELAGLYESTGDYESASAQLLIAARNECNGSLWLWFNAGRILATAGKLDEAKALFEVALKIDPEDADTWYMIGNIYRDKKDLYRAFHYYTEALKRKPDFAAIYNDMGSLSYNEEGNIKDAIGYMEKALTLNPDQNMQTVLYMNLANLHHKICDYDKHKYYQGKLLETVGFGADFISDEEDDDDDDND